jgi:CTP synthase
VIELARSVAGLTGANSSEFDKDSPYPVIDIMQDQQGLEQTGGTMRLGRYDCQLSEGTKARAVYGKEMIVERHRHRYEFNNKYLPELEAAGLRVAGINPDRNLVEVVELNNHPFFIGVQFHPELKSRPNRPHPLFAGLVQAALTYSTQKKEAL